jgi:LacI family transcriptional regulator
MILHRSEVHDNTEKRIIYHVMRKRVALVMGLADTYEHGIARGVVRYAKAREQWDLYGYGWMFRPFDALEVWNGDGIITRAESVADAARLQRLTVPVVDVAGAYPAPSFWAVTNDDHATGRRAGDYLVSCGFPRFAYCGVARTEWSEKRKRGFFEAVRGVDPAPSVFEESLAWWERLDSKGRLGKWLAGLRRPLAVFACNDTAGLKLASLCRDLGIPVPDSTAILGVDNEDILCEMTYPSLSSIELDCEEIGYRAAALLDEVMAAGERARPQERAVVVPPRGVVERESTRVYAGEDQLVQEAMRHIRLHGTEPSGIPELLAVIPASRRSLETRFKKATGRTLKQEIVRVRLAHARALLRTSRLTVADIASRSGFGSAQRFHETFLAAEGVSPGSYRRTRGT